MESYVAIIISMITFVFTVYQWLVSMNSRRPRARVMGLRPGRISFSKKLGLFRIYMPEKWHMVNFSDIPNSIMAMNVYAKICGSWIKGHFSHPYKLKEMVPALINGHTHVTFTDEPLCSGKTCYFVTL